MSNGIHEAILAAGGLTQVARRMGITPRRLDNWKRRGVPTAMVLEVCRGVEWRLTPHQLAPVLYPNPLDGMPRDPG